MQEMSKHMTFEIKVVFFDTNEQLEGSLSRWLVWYSTDYFS